MRRDGGALLGEVLVERGVLPDARALDDVLGRQAQRLPIASLCYVLGYAPERPLIAAVANARGEVGVVLDESVIHLDVLDALPRDTALRARVLPVYEEPRRLIVAVADARAKTTAAALADLERARGKPVEVYVALEVTLARTARASYLARARGDNYWVGAEAVVDPQARAGKLAVVEPDDPDAWRVDDAARAHRALIDDVTKEIAVTDLLLDDEDLSSAVDRAFGRDGTDAPGQDTPAGRMPTSKVTTGPTGQLPAGDAGGSTTSQLQVSTGAPTDGSGIDTPWPAGNDNDRDDETVELVAELDAVAPATSTDGGPPRVLVVDDDFATRHLLVKELQPLGYVTATAPSGGEAVQLVRQFAPDLVICDILLPEVDGFRLCRAFKRSRALGHIPVVLMSAVIDSGRVTDDVLARYGADAYLEKPLDSRRVHRVIRELLGRRRGKSVSGENGFQHAIALYQQGDVDGAIRVLRAAVAADPSSARYRFVLANLLQRNAMMAEAIDEYESVVQLEPEYFPALTRLAYLYYKQGLVARAVDTWRRSLPLCGDVGLRRNIELFMRKLIVEMGAVTGAGG